MLQRPFPEPLGDSLSPRWVWRFDAPVLDLEFFNFDLLQVVNPEPKG